MLPRSDSLPCLAPAATAGVSTTGSPEAELAARYAPALRLKQQVEECGDGEPYQPLDVDLLFGNEQVALRGPWEGTGVVKVAPTADDLATGEHRPDGVGDVARAPEPEAHRADLRLVRQLGADELRHDGKRERLALGTKGAGTPLPD